MKNAHLRVLTVSRIGLGAMTMAGTYTSEGALDDSESIRTIQRALDLGVNHIDTAEIRPLQPAAGERHDEANMASIER